ncbi:MAG: hypothetical protein PHF70_12360, partial [Opitutales bacterium]|nr:hypothetical protein [Opitutales bacterium]
CTVGNPVESFVAGDAPASIEVEGFKWELPWGYNKPENVDRNYPLVVFTLRHEASPFFTTELRKRYPAFFVTANSSTDAQAAAFVEAVNKLINTHHYRIDISRVYMTGFSWGGACTFKFVRAFHASGQPVAAVSRIAGDTEPNYIPDAVGNTTFWLHVGLEDTAARIARIRNLYACPPQHLVLIRQIFAKLDQYCFEVHFIHTLLLGRAIAACGSTQSIQSLLHFEGTTMEITNPTLKIPECGRMIACVIGVPCGEAPFLRESLRIRRKLRSPYLICR